jgi:transposase, IS5 family
MPSLDFPLQIGKKKALAKLELPRARPQEVCAPVTVKRIARPSAAKQVSDLLDSPELSALCDELEALRWTGRKGYPVRSLVGACLVKSLYAIPTWSRTAALIAEHRALRDALGDAPSVYALYRFATKLRDHKPLLDACLDRVTTSLRAELPEYGCDVAIDASDLPAFANGQRYVSKNGPERKRYSDPDASWGHRSAVSTRRGGGFYGYRLHAAVCARTDLPLAWEVATARTHEFNFALPLMGAVHARGFSPETAALDKGYDQRALYDALEDRGCRPIIPIKETPDVKRGEHEPPTCEHGRWNYAGADFKRKLTKWRCPTGECQPRSLWRKACRLHPLVPRETKRWRDLYRGRASVERAFGRLKIDYGLAPLRVRRLDRVALHADLCMLAMLSQALARARAVPIAA